MVTLIYPYRNRSVDRIKKSLDSLKSQSNQYFQVKFIDYGSHASVASEVKALVESYSFSEYTYSYTEFQPWNKSRALNIIIKNLKTDYCFVADVDMFYASSFIEKLHQLKNPNKAIYFQVGYLSEEETRKDIPFDQYVPKFLSTHEATGLTLFPVNKLKEVNGFDEFFHFWGAEDTDMHNRLKNLGLEVSYFDEEVLMHHQWHESFLVKNKRQFSKEFALEGIVKLNHKHKEMNKTLGISKVNEKGWGRLFNKETFQKLENQSVIETFNNEKADVDSLLNSYLVSGKSGIIGIQIVAEKSNFFENILKTLLGNKVAKRYTMKEVNDLLLTHLIANLRNKNYIYKVAENESEINLKIEL